MNLKFSSFLVFFHFFVPGRPQHKNMLFGCLLRGIDCGLRGNKSNPAIILTFQSKCRRFVLETRQQNQVQSMNFR